MSNLNKIGRELVLDLINRTNHLQVPLTFDDISFSLPTALEVADHLRNTQLTVSPTATSSFTRSKLITYWRLEIDKVLSGLNATIGLSADTPINNTNDLIAILNDRYGLMLTEEDVIYSEIVFLDTLTFFTLEMSATSYGYIGSVELSLTIDIDSIIYNNLLDGLEYPPEAVIENVSPSFITELGNLLTGTSIDGALMVTGTNTEAEIFIGAHKNLSIEQVAPANNTYVIMLEDNQTWSFSFGVGMLNSVRGVAFTLLYDAVLTIKHESNAYLDLTLETVNGQLVWSREGFGPSILDAVPTNSLSVAQTTRDTTSFGPYFPDAFVNGAGAHLGEFTFTFIATPKRAVYIKPIELTVTVFVIDA